MSEVDLELEEPLTSYQYQVQVKSAASLTDFESYAKQFSGRGFRKLYFVAHTPDAALATSQVGSPGIKLGLPERLAELAVNLGLDYWLMQRIK